MAPDVSPAIPVPIQEVHLLAGAVQPRVHSYIPEPASPVSLCIHRLTSGRPKHLLCGGGRVPLRPTLLKHFWFWVEGNLRMFWSRSGGTAGSPHLVSQEDRSVCLMGQMLLVHYLTVLLPQIHHIMSSLDSIY